MEIKNILKSARLNKKLSIRELSKISGVNASYISRLERGIDENPSTEILSKLCKYLNLNLTDIIPYITEEQQNTNLYMDVNKLLFENPQYKESVLDGLSSIYETIIGEFYKPSGLENNIKVSQTLKNNLELYRDLFSELHSFSNDSFLVSGKAIKNKDFYKLYNLRDKKLKRINEILNKIFKNYLIRYALVDDTPKMSDTKIIRNPNLP